MKSHGSGLPPWDFRSLGDGVVFETGALVFHPETVSIGADCYVGHYAILKGYYRNEMRIGAGSWIGQAAFLHSAGGLTIGDAVGIGPGVKILTSAHDLASEPDRPIMHRPLAFAPVVIGDGCDLGAGAVILPGVELGERVQVGAGAVVTKSFGSDQTLVGVPARSVGRSDTDFGSENPS